MARPRRSKLDSYAETIHQMLQSGYKYREIHNILTTEHQLKIAYTTLIAFIRRSMSEDYLMSSEEAANVAFQKSETALKAAATDLNKSMTDKMGGINRLMETHGEAISNIKKDIESFKSMGFNIHDFKENLKQIAASIYIGMQEYSPTGKKYVPAVYENMVKLYKDVVKTHMELERSLSGTNPYTFKFNINVKDPSEIPSPDDIMKEVEKKTEVKIDSDLVDYELLEKKDE